MRRFFRLLRLAVAALPPSSRGSSGHNAAGHSGPTRPKVPLEIRPMQIEARIAPPLIVTVNGQAHFFSGSILAHMGTANRFITREKLRLKASDKSVRPIPGPESADGRYREARFRRHRGPRFSDVTAASRNFKILRAR